MAFMARAWPRTQGSAWAAQRAASQVSGEQAGDRDAEPLTGGRNGLEERFRSGVHMAMQQDLTLVAPEADVPGAGMPVEAAVTLGG
jgi:hypothetical protein